MSNAFAALALDDDERGGKEAPESSGDGGAAAQPAAPSSAADDATAGWLPASAPRPRTPAASIPKLKDPLIFLDLEMTGLDPAAHTILELSLLATDGSLTSTHQGPTLAIHHPSTILNHTMNAWSKAMHARTGLTARCAASEVSMEEAEAAAVAFVCGVMGWGDGKPPRGAEEEDGEASSVREAGGGEEEEEKAAAAAPAPPRRPRLATLAGNSVHVDRAFLATHMPLLASCFSHRVVDVSGVSELASRWFPAAFHSRPRPPQESEGGGAHTAEADVKASLAELRHYRATVFKEDNKEAGRAVAKRYPYGTGGRRRRG